MKYGQGPDTPSNRGPLSTQQPTDNAGQERPTAPGTGIIIESEQRAEIVATNKRSGERIFHAKATRTIAWKYNVGPWELEYIGALDLFLKISGREGIGARQAQFIDWTGARTNWKHRMREAQQRAEREGLIEFIPAKGGKVIDITEKGRRCLEDYCKRFEEVKEDTRQRIIKGMLIRQAKEIKARNKVR